MSLSRTQVVNDFAMAVEQIAKSCIQDHHIEVIEKQKEAITELRKYVRQMEELTSGISLPQLALQQILKLKQEKGALEEKLTATITQVKLDTLYLTDDERYIKTCSLQQDLELTNQKLQEEMKSQKRSQDALQACEAMYSKCMRAVNAEFELEWGLGCRWVDLVDDSAHREKLMNERTEALQQLLDKIKTFKSQFRRKEESLAKYMEEMKSLRQFDLTTNIEE